MSVLKKIKNKFNGNEDFNDRQMFTNMDLLHVLTEGEERYPKKHYINDL